MASLKRSAPWEDVPTPPSKILKKSPVCTLHEMFRDVQFKLKKQEGPVHCPVFTISVSINGTEYEGKGKNKKTAKHQAALAALQSMVQIEQPDKGLLQPVLVDFTCDVPMLEDNHSSSIKNGFSVPEGNGSVVSKKLNTDKGPVMLLNELYPNAVYLLLSESGEQFNKYTTSLTINGLRYEGTGASKKLSKAAAARSALASLHNVRFHHTPTCLPAPDQIQQQWPASLQLPQPFADHVANLVTQKFSSLMSSRKEHARRKVLAGLVLSSGLDIASCRVISVSSGTKCVKGENMSVRGAVIQDSHAEIVSRRCIRKFFYDQIELLKNPAFAHNSIFLPYKDKIGFQLKDGVLFHLFISTAPCGDSRIFSPHDEEDQEDRHPNRKARGKLRTKIESGEGTIPIKTDEAIQTWDGIIQGERLLTMSCSDKLARWNVLGLQGALLSLVMPPIYLHSIILGSLFHPEHLYRAVTGRVESFIQGLPCPYRLNKPLLSLISSKEVRSTGKAPNFSVNWTEGDERAEVVNAMTGKTEEFEISRLAKINMLSRFTSLLQTNSLPPSLTSLINTNLSYGELKDSSPNYKLAKKELYEALMRGGFGRWTKKPIEVDQFYAPLQS